MTIGRHHVLRTARCAHRLCQVLPGHHNRGGNVLLRSYQPARGLAGTISIFAVIVIVIVLLIVFTDAIRRSHVPRERLVGRVSAEPGECGTRKALCLRRKLVQVHVRTEGQLACVYA